MKSIRLLFVFLAWPLLFQAQSAYFQQWVDYRIEVSLDDIEHTLNGTIEMDYTNNSPDELTFIYLHLWANGFRDRNTAFARQKVRQGSGHFYFAKDRELGNYSELDFTVDGQPAVLKLEKNNPDIAILTLPKALPSGGKVTIRSPFILKIPASFSRLGRVGESYQMTQWFPKPAVYDREGWHPMPYLDMGEYYSEFGSFDVQITLPENYIVAATGTLQTPSEIAFLEQNIKRSNTALERDLPTNDDFPVSSSKEKTIRYTADKVHDFAWFADKRFYVQKSQVTLQSNKKVDTWAFFTNTEGELWKKGTFYVDRAVQFYSENVGEYPYPQATAVQSALSAGGGMEYPMITVIGLAGKAQPLDNVITHEVGHNWFYGILAFNERDHPWLDEGLNSYYDHRYIERYYEASNRDFLPKILMKTTDYTLEELGYLYQSRRNLDQAPETTSDDFTRINYFLGAYEKPAVAIKYLEKYLGTERFDRIMKGFYEQWKFKHPGPKDFQEYLVKESGETLSWFFDGFLYSNKKLDYAIGKVQQIDSTQELTDLQVTVKNKGAIDAPVLISGVRDSQVITTQWYPGFSGKQTLDFPSGDYDRLVIDAQHYTPDLYRHNNTSRVAGLFRRVPPLRIKFPLGLEHSKQATVFATPLLTWNNYDKTMVGLALYNSPLPAKRFEYAIAPMYAFVTKDINGLANLQYHFYLGSNIIQQATINVDVKRFNAVYNWPNEYYLQYTKIAPALQLDLATKANSPFHHHLKYRAIILQEDRAQFSQDTLNPGVYLGVANLSSLIHEVSYWGGNKKAVNPWSYRVVLEQQNYQNSFDQPQSYFKGSLEWKAAYTYDRGKNINLRFFAGGFFSNTRKNAGNFYNNVSNRGTRGSYALTYQGYNDDKYDHLFFGRNEERGIWSQQVAIQEGGLKNAFGSNFTTIGLSNSFVWAINLKADLPQDLPFKIPLKPYFDFGYFQNRAPLRPDDITFADQTMWSFGLSLEWFKGDLAIFFPLANSKNIKNFYLQRGKYWARIAYTMNLNAFNPFDLVNKISF